MRCGEHAADRMCASGSCVGRDANKSNERFTPRADMAQEDEQSGEREERWKEGRKEDKRERERQSGHEQREMCGCVVSSLHL